MREKNSKNSNVSWAREPISKRPEVDPKKIRKTNGAHFKTRCLSARVNRWLPKKNKHTRNDKQLKRKEKNQTTSNRIFWPRWIVGKIKKPMILCARNTSYITWTGARNTEMRKVCLFYSQNNNILWLSNMANTWIWDIHAFRQRIWALFLAVLCFSDADWLGRQTQMVDTPIRRQY